MRPHLNKIYRFHYLITAFIFALVLTFAPKNMAYAGDPEDIIGPMNEKRLTCIDSKSKRVVSTVDGDVVEDDGTINLSLEVDLELLKKECRKRNTPDEGFAIFDLDGNKVEGPFKIGSIQETRIEGFVFEFHPRDPENPAESEWYAVPSQFVPVVAEGVTFEIFWGSEPNGYFYYPNNFGEGPIMLNLRLPEDAHPINPDILIESTGLPETWTVFLGFYRGDVAPPVFDQLKTPNGNFLPFGNTKYESIVGLDGKSALPGVGGVLPQTTSMPVVVLASIVLIALPTVSIIQFRKQRDFTQK